MIVKMKRLKTILHKLTVSCFICLSFASGACKAENSAFNTDKKEVLYTATTVDECISEKECVWHEFTKLITQSNLEKKYEWRLSRWEVPVQIKIIGNNKSEYDEDINQSLEILDKYFPSKITINDKKINFFIAFTNSIKDDFYKSDYNFWQTVFKHNTVFIEQAINANDGGDPRCVQVTMHNSQFKNIVGVLFIDKKNPAIQDCIQKGLKSAWTAPYYLTPYLAKYHPENFENHNINKLDLFLQALLYDPNFQTNMTFFQVEEVFEQAYADTINRFRDQLEKLELP
jgi:hypothetical protein